MLKALVLTTMIFGAVFGQECPNVNSLQCFEKQPAAEDCRVQTFITLEDGTKCPGCQICVPTECPHVACPKMLLDPTCINPKFYAQLFTIDGGKECRGCSTFICQ